MADSLITNLTAGNPAQSGDELVANRSGSDVKLTAGSIAALSAPGGSSGQIQYNSGGAFAGSATFTWDVPALTLEMGDGAGNNTVIRGKNAATATDSGSGFNINGGQGGATSGNGGSAQLAAGTATAGDGGAAVVRGGNASGAGKFSGSARLAAGIATSGATGGDTNILAGESDSGAGGNTNISGGYSDSGAAGNVIITPGETNTGTQGQIIINLLPTSDPGISGALWNSAGTLKISP